MIQIPTPNRTFFARLGVLTVAVAAMLAMSATTLGSAGAASSGGIGSPGSGGEESDDDGGQNDGKYGELWNKTSSKDRKWARSTSDCESGGDPKAIGGGGSYRGAFQFMKSTWKASPKSPGGDPINYAYKTQAVVAIALKNRDGAGHWPVCG